MAKFCDGGRGCPRGTETISPKVKIDKKLWSAIRFRLLGVNQTGLFQASEGVTGLHNNLHRNYPLKGNKGRKFETFSFISQSLGSIKQ
jgi:hypothetical protein